MHGHKELEASMYRRAFLDFAHDGRNLAHLVLSSPWLGPCIKFVSSFSITAYSSRRFYTFLLTTLHVLLCRIMLRSLTLFSCCLLLLSYDPLVQAQQCRLVAPNGLLANPSPSATPSTSPTPTSPPNPSSTSTSTSSPLPSLKPFNYGKDIIRGVNL